MKYEKRILNHNKILKKAKKKQDTETIKRTKAQIILLKSEMKDLYSWRNYFQANLQNTLNKMDKKNMRRTLTKEYLMVSTFNGTKMDEKNMR